MGKFNRYQSDAEQYARCHICQSRIMIEDYMSEGETIICQDCGAEYSLLSRKTFSLGNLNRQLNPLDYYDAKRAC